MTSGVKYFTRACALAFDDFILEGRPRGRRTGAEGVGRASTPAAGNILWKQRKFEKKSKTNNVQNLINDTILKKIALSQEHLYFWYFLYKYFLAQSLARIVYHHLAFDFFLEGRARRNPK